MGSSRNRWRSRHAETDAAMDATMAEVRRRLARLTELESRNKDLEDLFHLQQSHMGEAVEFWRRQTGRHDVTPDLGGLLAFLLKEIDERGKVSERQRRRIPGEALDDNWWKHPGRNEA